jgi:SAM-dependent methyltransferase
MSKLWEHYGANDPYYGVLSAPEFHSDRMNDDALHRFFASGVQDVDAYLALAEDKFGPLNFDTALDYGCGAGRLSRRLVERFRHVISVDISGSMLALTRKNIDARNISFENAAHMSDAKADFILSKMVFQHIPPAEGLRVLAKLASRLRGTGIIELPIRDKASAGWRALRLAKRALRAALPFTSPVIPMYAYSEREATAALGDNEVVVEHFDAPRFEYARLIFRR